MLELGRRIFETTATSVKRHRHAMVRRSRRDRKVIVGTAVFVLKP